MVELQSVVVDGQRVPVRGLNGETDERLTCPDVFHESSLFHKPPQLPAFRRRRSCGRGYGWLATGPFATGGSPGRGAPAGTATRSRGGPGHQPDIVNLTGGLSHIDSFDHKPRLQADHGKTIDWRGPPFFLNASPFRFRPYGENGLLSANCFLTWLDGLTTWP
ncbi:MAG: hypothetical protein Ct9H300mP1_39360 [Planctomycetaceae bacterium]|nr:MAG: hypothetical protein Ct9H300mP1_39360 [Planctomycetaceae bacterium]